MGQVIGINTWKQPESFEFICLFTCCSNWKSRPQGQDACPRRIPEMRVTCAHHSFLAMESEVSKRRFTAGWYQHAPGVD